MGPVAGAVGPDAEAAGAKSVAVGPVAEAVEAEGVAVGGPVAEAKVGVVVSPVAEAAEGEGVGPVAEAAADVVVVVCAASKALSCKRMSWRRARSSSASRFQPCAVGGEAGAADTAGAHEAWCFDSRTLSATRRSRSLASCRLLRRRRS